MTQIDIPNPVVTPTSLDALYYILTKEQLPDIESRDEYVKAAHYLGADVLLLLGDPKFMKIRSHYPTINFVHPRELHDFFVIMRIGVQHGVLGIGMYLFRIFPADLTHDIDNDLLVFALWQEDPDYVDLLLKRGADPTTP